jgi:hypothetical protein
MTTEQLEKQLSRTHDWIKSVDQKISITLALEIGIIALLATPSAKLFATLYPNIRLGQTLLIALIAFVFAYAVFKAVWALKPRTKMPKKMTSLIFFESIADMTLKEYKRKAAKINTKDHNNDLEDQIYISAAIAKTKHRSLAVSLYLLLTGLVLWLVMAVWVGYSTLV